jgi:hypothetical protein
MRYLLATLLLAANLWANNCLKCHGGIEPIREPDTGMAKAIAKKAAEAGVGDNTCVVCHGGNPEAATKEEAHRGAPSYLQAYEGPKAFYPDPGSAWINRNTCGMCHKEQVAAQNNSLMMTEQGKIHGTLYSFGGLEGYRHDVGNYATQNPDPHERLGTDAYRRYMEKLARLNPQVFPEKMKELPPAPTPEEVEKNPKLAAYTYLRQECLRCHTGSKGRQKRGDYRGMGCSSCHIPYSNDGYYEGADPTIPKEEPGHLLIHRIQSSVNAKVTVHGTTYTGVPVETCATCHNRGKRIGVSYEGLMETAYKPTFDAHGNAQPKLHTKHYLHLKEDVHMKKGMLCQDCHTTRDLHGDGFLAGATLGPVEIECQDCHGTTRRFPWELPLGYGDEFAAEPAKGEPRGVVQSLPEYLKKKGSVFDRKEGYLLTARGNPYKNVVKEGDEVVVYLASGKKIRLQPLKKLKQEGRLSKEGLVAMDTVVKHNDRMECYSCHDTWAPQCYGCHVKIDYSRGHKEVDWLSAAHDRDIHGTDAMKRGTLREHLIPGKVTETRSYLRWENPPLVQNGEGRVSPAMPGCQVVVTVIGKEGEAILQNHVFEMPDYKHPESGRRLPGIVMASVHSHTVQKEARACESCHANPAAMGYGIEGGRVWGDMGEDFIVDLKTADGKVIPTRYTVQKPKIDNFHGDWSRFVDENGTWLQTVDNHWNLAGPLSNEQRAKLDRRGACLACHQSLPEGSLATSLMHHIAEVSGIKIDTRKHNEMLDKNIRIAAWAQVLGALALLMGGLYLYRKRRNR